MYEGNKSIKKRLAGEIEEYEEESSMKNKEE